MSMLRRYIFSCLLVFSLPLITHATHYRAGELLYRYVGNFKFEVTIISYTKYDGISIPADRDTVYIDWGDGTSSALPRTNGNGNGVIITTNPISIKKNEYTGVHTYPGAPPPPNRFYIISFYDQNRIDGINNIDNGNSINIPFYVEDTLKFPTDMANIGSNSSPILLNPPIDYACVRDTFFHNPNAYDPDGDSITFDLIVPLQDQGIPVSPLYQYPDLYCGGGNSFTIDRHTGLVTWATPCQQGIFNIAILIREFRNGINLGTMIRDMQIIVNNCNNDPPRIDPIADTCIRAGDSLRINIRATDPQSTQTVTLTANGGPFQIPLSPAQFSATNGNPATGIFSWETVCDHIRGQPYQVVFKAEDNYTIPGPNGPSILPLVDLETWQIRVIPPPVEHLTATPVSGGVLLSWQNPYSCAGFTNFRGFSVWRKNGCDNFIPDYCETGLAGRGYTKLTTSNIFTYDFTDLTAVVGEEYTYRIVAHFSRLSPNGIFEYDAIESVPSNGVCYFRPINIPVILNVDVTQTDPANGTIFVRWTKPLAGGNNLDTLLNPPPYRFELYRGEGFHFANPQLIHTTTANSFYALNDTTFTDTGIDTKNHPWSYRIAFYSSNDTIGYTATASSVFLNIIASDQSLSLTWQEYVPWTNDSFSIFRFNKTTALFDSIAVTPQHSYTDTGLINDSTYCYYIKSFGRYSLALFPAPLLNKSQQECALPIDTVAPCPPVLSVINDCATYDGRAWEAPSFVNHLHWHLSADSCSEDVTHYRIYFSADSAGWILIDSTMAIEDTLYNHLLSDNLAGCYAVTAIDRIGNESIFSNVFCIDNCPYYILPNTFTPNGDGQNDIFHPFKPYRFVPKIEMHIYNRWGEEVFYTEDPEINWDGTDQKTGKPLSEGVYVYAGYYYEQHLNGLVKKPLSGQKKGGGFIHLLRGNAP